MISFSLSRAIKGKETGKPKLSPAGNAYRYRSRSARPSFEEGQSKTLLEESKFAVT